MAQTHRNISRTHNENVVINSGHIKLGSSSLYKKNGFLSFVRWHIPWDTSEVLVQYKKREPAKELKITPKNNASEFVIAKLLTKDEAIFELSKRG